MRGGVKHLNAIHDSQGRYRVLTTCQALHQSLETQEGGTNCSGCAAENGLERSTADEKRRL